MDQFAANTLRTLGIILTAGFVLIASLLLALLSLCAAAGAPLGSKRPDQALIFALCAVLVAVLGITLIARLARGISRSAASAKPAAAISSVGGVSTPAAAPAGTSLPVHLSPSSRRDLDRLVFAMIAQIVLSFASWFFNQLHYWTAPRTLAPHNWILILLAPFVLYHVPYAVLIYRLPRKQDRSTFAYAL